MGTLWIRQADVVTLDDEGTILRSTDLLIEIRFWAANSLEELDRLEEALGEYRSLLDRYPNPKVIEIKIRSIESRLKTITARQPATTSRPSEPE